MFAKMMKLQSKSQKKRKKKEPTLAKNNQALFSDLLHCGGNIKKS